MHNLHYDTLCMYSMYIMLCDIMSMCYVLTYIINYLLYSYTYYIYTDIIYKMCSCDGFKWLLRCKLSGGDLSNSNPGGVQLSDSKSRVRGGRSNRMLQDWPCCGLMLFVKSWSMLKPWGFVFGSRKPVYSSSINSDTNIVYRNVINIQHNYTNVCGFCNCAIVWVE